MEKKIPHKFPYLSYHLKPSSMMDAVTGGFDLGTSVFNEYIQLAEALRDEDKIVFADVESMAGLCRLIIAREKEIHFLKPMRQPSSNFCRYCTKDFS